MAKRRNVPEGMEPAVAEENQSSGRSVPSLSRLANMPPLPRMRASPIPGTTVLPKEMRLDLQSGWIRGTIMRMDTQEKDTEYSEYYSRLVMYRILDVRSPSPYKKDDIVLASNNGEVFNCFNEETQENEFLMSSEHVIAKVGFADDENKPKENWRQQAEDAEDAMFAPPPNKP